MRLKTIDKPWWMSHAAIALCLFAATFFPFEDVFQKTVARIAFLVVLPLIFIRFFLKRRLRDFGWTSGDMAVGIRWSGMFLTMEVAIGVAVFRYTEIFANLTIPQSVRASFAMFLTYIGFSVIFLVVQEIFFRGFVLRLWQERFGWKAVPAQALLSVLPALAAWQSVSWGAIVFAWMVANASGWIAYRSGSIVYALLFSSFSAILGISSVLLFVK
jgi:membrane protease YdiL (CAAX protease family)